MWLLSNDINCLYEEIRKMLNEHYQEYLDNIRNEEESIIERNFKKSE